MRTRIKICCVSSNAEAAMAISHGADAIGLVGKMPSGPGPIDDSLINSICKNIHPPISSFLLTSAQTSGEIIDHLKRTNTNTVQIVDELKDNNYPAIREALPYIRIVQVIHVTGPESIERAIKLEPGVDALLLDSGNPNASIKTLGGTGKQHDWAISKKIVDAVNIPVFLAGGLNALNVTEAIKMIKPFGVDICSGVRTNGKLDESKLKEFIRSVHHADF